MARIPPVLFKGLLNGNIKSDSITILAASGNVTTYKVRGFNIKINVPDELVEYMKNIGSIDSYYGEEAYEVHYI